MSLSDSILFRPGGFTDTDVWGTPQKFFNTLNAEFHFTLDPCANAANCKCARYFNIEQNGLIQDWGTHNVFMNPPYSFIKLWMRKAWKASLYGATVVCLVPMRSDTAWWHLYAPKGEVRYVRGRLSFTGEHVSVRNAAPFPSAVIIYRPE